MTKLIIMLSMFFTAMLCQAQVSENRQVENFTQMEVANGIELFYEQEDTVQSVRVESISSESLKSVKTESKNGILNVYTTSSENNNSPKIKVFVTGKSVLSIKGKSNARIVFRLPIKGTDIKINLLDGAYFNGSIRASNQVWLQTDSNTEFNGRIETKVFTGNFKNKSRVNLSGIADEARIISRNKAYCNAKNFLVQNTEIHSNDATVLITSKNKLLIDLNENAKLTYYGNPENVNIKNGTMLSKERKINAKMLVANKE